MRRVFMGMIVLLLLTTVVGVSLAQEPVTLRFWTNWGGPSFEALRASFDEYEAENPGITVELEQGVATDKVIVAVAAGVGPNAFVTAGGYFGLANQGYLMPLDGFIARSDVLNSSKYPPDIWESLKVDGQIYGIPALEAASIYGLNWNVRHFDEAGLEPFSQDIVPTYDEVLENHRKLTRFESDRSISNLGYLPWGGVQSGLAWWSLGFNAVDGVTFPREDGQIRLSDPNLVDGINLIAQEVYQTIGYGVIDSYLSAVPGRGAYSNGIFNDSVSIAGDGYWTAGRAVVESPDETYGTTWMPNVDRRRHQMVGGFRVAIPHGTENLEETWKLVEFIAGPRVTQAVFDATGFATPHLDFVRNADMDQYPGLSLYMRDLALADYIATPVNLPYSADVGRLFREAVEGVFRGETSAFAALEDADRQIAALAREAEAR